MYICSLWEWEDWEHGSTRRWYMGSKFSKIRYISSYIDIQRKFFVDFVISFKDQLRSIIVFLYTRREAYYRLPACMFVCMHVRLSPFSCPEQISIENKTSCSHYMFCKYWYYKLPILATISTAIFSLTKYTISFLCEYILKLSLMTSIFNIRIYI